MQNFNQLLGIVNFWMLLKIFVFIEFVDKGRFITCRLSKWGILGRVCREDVEVEVDSGQVRMRERVFPSPFLLPSSSSSSSFPLSSSSPSTVVRLVGDGKLQWDCQSDLLILSNFDIERTKNQ